MKERLGGKFNKYINHTGNSAAPVTGWLPRTPCIKASDLTINEAIHLKRSLPRLKAQVNTRNYIHFFNASTDKLVSLSPISY
jgi:hypothetical protein